MFYFRGVFNSFLVRLLFFTQEQVSKAKIFQLCSIRTCQQYYLCWRHNVGYIIFMYLIKMKKNIFDMMESGQFY